MNGSHLLMPVLSCDRDDALLGTNRWEFALLDDENNDDRTETT